MPTSQRAIAIGNFDGVHRGHQRVLDGERAVAVLTFDPHPAVVLGRAAPKALTLLPRKKELLLRHGASEVIVKAFDREFASWSPERFVDELLSRELGARAVVVGKNFRFGRARAGDYAELERLGKARGIEVQCFELSGDDRGRYSSTRVREALARGDIEDATHVLGRPHAFSGVVARGAQRGRTIGFPTANVDEVGELVPARGVYAVVVDEIGDEARALGRGVMNVGVKPTVGDSAEATREVHLFDFDRDLYGAHVRVHVIERLREETKFASLDELRAQIAKDAARAREITAEIAPKFAGAFG